MKVFVTGGGTTVPIDRIRKITNHSEGTFASKIANECLKNKMDVTLLVAEKARTPFSKTIDFYGMSIEQRNQVFIDLARLETAHVEYKNHYEQVRYDSYSDYAQKLKEIIAIDKPDVVILAAAVSDYGIENVVDGKIRTKEDLTLKMVELEKLIGQVKSWHPDTYLVGFKMLVNSSPNELISEANKSIQKNKCDLVIANDWATLGANHQMYMVQKNRAPELCLEKLEWHIVNRVLEDYREQHPLHYAVWQADREKVF